MAGNIQVDLGAALERCSGDTELLSQVVTETMEKAQAEQVPKIRSAMADGDVKEVHFHAHSIKGASATIGFLSLSAAAKELDDLVKGESLAGAEPLVDNLETELKRALDYYQKHCEAQAEALERCGGDTELFNQISKEMVSDVIPGQLEALEAAVLSGDAPAVDAGGRQLLDAAETIGAFNLMALAKPMIDKAEAGSLDGSAEALEEVKAEIERVTAYWDNLEDDEGGDRLWADALEEVKAEIAWVSACWDSLEVVEEETDRVQ
eukprot:CAMPEP_0206239264 /NCGR_PEP_ID=MMETSP0047_2-20121206/15281_1 /ASSEMBLY_ACC=CAM_ASM_000192 /TAXON_ID=195065 /ORGANISM="Chroomonas mesostigmatica_cf, Strain CCMP1168" /LENGTH=263 /DNA_ID=CAMNT_0053663905 /DNA_START=48 /DNA_END=837 /DNA_ORIENTATION=+